MAYDLNQLSFSWRLADNTFARATFAVETQDYDEPHDRIIVILKTLLTALDDRWDEATKHAISGLVGKWVQAPTEARLGLTLPLKYETLTGRIRYFYAQDPRTIAKPAKKLG